MGVKACKQDVTRKLSFDHWREKQRTYDHGGCDTKETRICWHWLLKKKKEKSNEMKTRRILDNFHPWKKARPGSSKVCSFKASKNRRLFTALQKSPIADNSLFPFQKADYAERKPQSSSGPLKRCIFSQVIKEMQTERIIGYRFTVKIFAPVKRNG